MPGNIAVVLCLSLGYVVGAGRRVERAMSPAGPPAGPPAAAGPLPASPPADSSLQSVSVKDVESYAENTLAAQLASIKGSKSATISKWAAKVHAAGAAAHNGKAMTELAEKNTKEATGQLDKIREDIEGDTAELQEKAEAKAKATLDHIHGEMKKAAHLTIDAAVGSAVEQTQEELKEQIKFAHSVQAESHDIEAKGMKANTKVLEEAQKLHESVEKLPMDEVEKMGGLMPESKAVLQKLADLVTKTKDVAGAYTVLFRGTRANLLKTKDTLEEAEVNTAEAADQATVNGEDIQALKASAAEIEKLSHESLVVSGGANTF